METSLKPRVLVFVATFPSAPYLHPASWQSITRLRWRGQFELLVLMDKFNESLAGDALVENVGQKYARARDIFLESGWNALLTIEADIIVPSDALEKLVSVDADIVYGLYCSRPNKRHRWMLRRGERLGIDTADYEPEFLSSVWNQVVPSDGLGTGCTLIHRRVLEALEFHWSPGLGHDWHLAKDAKAAGFRQMHDCRVHVGHILKPGVAVWPDPNTTFRIVSTEAKPSCRPPKRAR